ncbi:ABZJ_00895 family protein [Roseobacter sp. EG26]|uniref:ABZJ_00895 family protein n=1 Tax=Roseobacter sp. EG26 TaxID=3412477 RepID=UPI003CE4A53E
MIFRPLRFCLNYIMITIATIVLTMIIQSFVAFDLSSVGTSVIPLLAAAMIEGQYFGRHCEGPPAKATIWRASLKMAGIVMVLSVLLMGLLALVSSGVLSVFAAISPATTMLILVFAVLFSWVILRLGYGMGLRSGMSQIA